ncbi:allatostatin-A receptor-like [Liolophura sinensis]|uniref:allatostatin-A receptor-like n=1 Tax=Liolophura sinensis TaxID=3198878 RepID=UPI003158E3A7
MTNLGGKPRFELVNASKDYENDGFFNYEGDIDNLRHPWIREAHFIPTVTVFASTFLLGVVGNSLVVFALVGDKKRRNVTSSFLVSLACADILFLMICVPYEIVRYFIGPWSIGPSLCKLSGSVEMLSAVASIMNLTAISVERYIVIVHPMKSRFLCTGGKTSCIIIFVWSLALASSFPTFFVMDTESLTFYKNDTYVTIVTCSDYGIPRESRFSFAMYRVIVMFAAPTAVMVFCYVCVINALWLSTKELKEMTEPYRMDLRNGASSKNRESAPLKVKRRSSEARETRKQLGSSGLSGNEVIRSHDLDGDGGQFTSMVIRMLITIIVFFLLCWGPNIIYKLIRTMQMDELYTMLGMTLKIIFDLLPYVQSCLNPIIYGFMSKNFRRSMRTACMLYVCKTRRRKMSCLHSTSKRRDYELDTKRLGSPFIRASPLKVSMRSTTKTSYYYEESEDEV